MAAFYFRTAIRRFSSIAAQGTGSYLHVPSSRPLLGITVPEVIDKTLEEYGDREAVVDCAQNLRKNYVQYIQDIERLAKGFLSLGHKRGDRVGIFATNSYQWLLTQYAANMSGLILVAINPTNQPRELEHCLRLAGVRTLVASEEIRGNPLYSVIQKTIPEIEKSIPGQIKNKGLPDFQNVIMISDKHHDGAWRFEDIMSAGESKEQIVLEEAKKRVQIHDPAYIIFTSGSTGLPKGATISHHSACNMAYFTGVKLNLNQARKVICQMGPLFHAIGLMGGSVMCMTFGQKIVYPAPTYSVSKLIQALHDEKCTSLVGTPTMFIDMLKNTQFEKYDLSALQRATIGGASATAETMGLIKDKFGLEQILSTYGCTECTLAISMTGLTDPLELARTSVGSVLEHTEVKVVDEAGNVVPWNGIGEILVRGYLTMLGYWGDPEKTKAAFTQDGYYRTGDLVTLSPDGIVRIVGRISDMILRGGQNVYPKEIEDFLSSHPKVHESYVFGVPDERLGEQVCAWVMLKPGQNVTAEELTAFCKGGLAPYKVPFYFTFVKDFPRLGSGKVDKKKMAAVQLSSDQQASK